MRLAPADCVGRKPSSLLSWNGLKKIMVELVRSEKSTGMNLNEPPLVSFSSVKRMMKRIGTLRVSNQDVGNMQGSSEWWVS